MVKPVKMTIRVINAKSVKILFDRIDEQVKSMGLDPDRVIELISIDPITEMVPRKTGDGTVVHEVTIYGWNADVNLRLGEHDMKMLSVAVDTPPETVVE